jgi:pyochelin synthetase
MKELLVTLKELDVRLHLEGDDLRIVAPQGALTAELKQALRLHKASLVEALRAGKAVIADALPQIEPEPALAHEPFALSDLQQAYWLGRVRAMELGSVATHIYTELDSRELDIERLTLALRKLIQRHGILRAIVDTSGLQRILPEVPDYHIPVYDASAASDAELEQAIEETRQALSHQVFTPGQWPLFDVRLTQMKAGRQRLHVSLDMLIMDGRSIGMFFAEWMHHYTHPQAEAPAIGVSYRDYILAERALREQPAYKRALEHWMSRVDTLPPAPELPVRLNIDSQQAGHFTRRGGRLAADRWLRLKTAAKAHGLTPSSLVMALYAEVLARWSAAPRFTLNLTLGNRMPLHPQVQQLLGNFSSLMLQEVDRTPAERSFAEFALALQKQFMANYEHRQVCGVSVMREWTKRRRHQMRVAMPVVFTSALLEAAGGTPAATTFGPRVYTASQTSQVWLDHVATEDAGAFCYDWYSADGVFEPGVVDAMFAAYSALIERVADDPELLRTSQLLPLPAAMQQRRDTVAATAAELPTEALHAGFVAQARARPNALALVAHDRQLSYGELLSEAAAVADTLLAGGLGAGQPVAVVARKGWEQVVAVYGVLLAGGAYMPVDADLPDKRKQDLLAIGEVAQVLTAAGGAQALHGRGSYQVHEILPGQGTAFGPLHEASLQTPLDQLAYVIFTSGTTGVPKGVMIDHRGAANTLLHVSRMFGIDASTRVLGVSSLSFDLSVYDIFGVLGQGGVLVLPDARKGHDADHWRELVHAHGVNLWNSAPQLMQMLMDCHAVDDRSSLPLRTVMLSGDFIPLDLPGRIHQRAPGAQVISLGGATEASIWSNYHRIDGVQPEWVSIPYGRALPNQSMAVYDAAMQLCPDHVRGRIFIGGIGLALGYWRDAAKTAERFIVHPRSGERLYDTGDLGRYAEDGEIVIVGRNDGQVKVRGHRIELGEVEAVLRRLPGIKQAVASVIGKAGERRQLAAHLELAFDADPQVLHANAVLAHVAEHLPEYMVPQHLMFVDRIPVSANGKVDRQALPPIQAEGAVAVRVAPRNATEQTILDLWSRVFVGVELGVTDNFFELGGDSLLLTQLLRDLNAVMPFAIDVGQLYQAQTTEKLAALYAEHPAAAGHHTAAAAHDEREHEAAPVELLA